MKQFLRLLTCAVTVFLFSTANAQTTIPTTGFLNNNGSNVVTFNFVNNNAAAVIITDVAGITGVSGANSAQLWYKPGAISGPPGAITVGNGWTQAANGNFTGVANTTTTTTQPMITGMSLTIPAGATYGLAFNVTNSLRYSTIPAGTYTFTGGGCNIVTGTSIGYGGTLASPTNTPRGFLGSITFITVAPCSGAPNPGNTLSSANPVCPNSNFILSMQNSQGSGTTYQWQSSPDGITWTNIVGATNATYTTAITTPTYYQVIATCANSGLSTTSAPIFITVSFTASCYCTTIPAFTGDEEITNTTVGTLNNSSTCATVAPGPGSQAARYGNYTSGPGIPSAPLFFPGSPQSFSITVGSCGTTNFTSGLAIFIDYNIDGDFLDANEKVYSNGPNVDINCVPATIVTGSFTVSPVATTGTTVMRIMNVEGTSGDNITPCLAYNYGETEDYLVSIQPAPSVDMGATLLVSPLTTGCHTSTETVTVEIKNFGSTPINFATNPVTVNASVTGPNAMTFTPVVINTGTLAVNATQNVVITTTYNMTAAGTYTFSANTAVTGDGLPSNNAITPVAIINSGGVATVSNSTICLGSSVDLNLAGQTNGGPIQWQSSPNNSTWTSIPGATTNPYNIIPGGLTYYRAMVCGNLISVVDTVSTITVSAPTATNGTRCGPGSVTIGATATDSVNWFSGPTGGPSLHTGSTYTTNVTATTTFYAENTFTACGAGGFPATPTCYPVYSNACSSNDFINNFSTSFGSTNISNLSSGCNGSSPSNTTFFPSQIVTCTPGGTFDIAVQAGTAFGQGHRIWIDYNNDGDFVDAGEAVWASANSNTIVNTGSITVPANTTPGPKRIRVMCRYANVPQVTDVCATTLSFGEVEEYTLNVCTQCVSARVAVTANVTVPPSISASVADSTLCGNDTTVFAVNSSNANYAYTWSPAAFLNTTTSDSVLFMPTAPGSFEYYVDAIDGSTGCSNRDTVHVMMSAIPSVVATVDVTPVCSGTTVNLSGTQPPTSVQVTNGNLTNTSTTYPAPYGQFYGGARHQMLILASELTAVGMGAGTLSGLSFQVTNTNAAAPLTDFTIQMGTTTAIDLSAGFVTYSATQVYTNSSYAPTTGINVHTFSTPFYWDGVSNIIVETCFANYTTAPNTTFTTNASMRQTTMPFVATAYNRYDNTANICGLAHIFTDVMRPNIAFIRSFGSWTYAWTPSANVATPNMQNTTATPPTTTPFIATVTDTTSGCFSSDTVTVTVNPTPMPMLGNDTAICSNTVLTLDGSSGPYTYLWNNSTTNQTLAVNAFGNYDVLVTDSITGCAGADTILVGIDAAPSFNLGSDVTICTGNSVTFSGPGGQYDYLWSNSDVTQTTTVSTAGNYELVVTDQTNLCFNSDTVALIVNPLPAVALGSDTSVCSANVPLTLSAPAGNYSYSWSDASTGATLNVTTTGSYYVTVTDNATTCFDGDTIVVNIAPSPVVALGNDTIFCSASGPITITATAGPYNYLWSDLSGGISLTTNTTGNYSVTVTDSISGCAATDAINVTVNVSPVVNLGADTAQCGGSVTLDAQNAGSDFTWSTADTTQMIVVSATGTYYVDVVSAAGCASSDSIMVTINTTPNITFTLQNTACSTDPAFAMNGSPAGGTYNGPGVAGNMFSPSAAGVGSQTITYNYTDANGCFGSIDEVIVVSACVGVDEPFVAAGMNLFPNPNNGLFTLTINDADYTEIMMEIVTVDGRVIYSDKASDVKGQYVKQLDLSAHANGIYFLRVTANGQSYMQKVVKQD